jgi:hypothetical protein
LICVKSSVRLQREALENTANILNSRKDNEALEEKQYCSAASLDIYQAFDHIWYTGLTYKLRLFLHLNYFLLLKSYLNSRHFLIKFESDRTEISPAKARVPQGSGPRTLQYLLYTADLPTSSESTTAMFVVDTAVLAMDSDPGIVTQELQTNLEAM